MAISTDRRALGPSIDVDAADALPLLRWEWRILLVVLAAWTGLWLLESVRTTFLIPDRVAPGLTFKRSLIINLPWWGTWAALTPLIVWLASRIRLDGDRPRILLAAGHLITGVIISQAHLAIAGSLFFYFTRGATASSVPALLRQWMQGFLILNLMTYGVVVGVFYAVSNARRYRARTLEAARLSAQTARLRQGLVEAKLHSLQRELNPHFLFNSLNGVSGLIRRQETEAALTMLARVSDLLRATLERGDSVESRLDAELHLLNLYLEVERARFGPRLTIEYSIAAGIESALVPTLILQPLVENAVRHGVARQTGAGRIGITASREDQTLRITIQNTGTATRQARGVPDHDGIGHSNTRARLAELYGNRAGLEFRIEAGAGVVSLWVPWHTEPVLPITPETELATWNA